MSTTRQLQEITAADIMRSDLITVPTTMPLAEAERLLVEHGIGGAPVTDHAGRIAGVVSLRDIADRHAERGRGGRAPAHWAEAIEEREGGATGTHATEPGAGMEAATPSDVARGVAGEGPVSEISREASPAGPGRDERELQRMATGDTAPPRSQDVVADAMTGQVHAVDADTHLPELSRVMVDHAIHRVLVRRASDAAIVGLVSSMDVLRALARSTGRGGDAS